MDIYFFIFELIAFYEQPARAEIELFIQCYFVLWLD